MTLYLLTLAQGAALGIAGTSAINLAADARTLRKRRQALANEDTDEC